MMPHIGMGLAPDEALQAPRSHLRMGTKQATFYVLKRLLKG